MLTKSSLIKVFSEHGFTPLKRLGENYLIDANIRDKIVRESGISAGDIVVEIGPGMGALTFDFAEKAAGVFAVEIDKKACAILTELAGSNYPNLKIINKDVLKFDLAAAAGKAKVKVVGNLPYYITSPIIEYLIGRKNLISCAMLMVQKEVALRLMAKPGAKVYGSISCYVNYHTRPAYIHTVKRTSFYPVPEVDSAVLRLDIPDKPCVDVDDEDKFFRIIRGSFNQRRKSILNSISRKAVLDMPKAELSALLRGIGIDPSARPETLSLSDFALISNSLSRI